jgi:hypothetical protein
VPRLSRLQFVGLGLEPPFKALLPSGRLAPADWALAPLAPEADTHKQLG